MPKKPLKITRTEIKEIIKELKKAYPEIKDIILFPIAYSLALIQISIQHIIERPEKERQLKEKLYKDRINIEEAAKTFELIKQLKAKEELKIAEEIRTEERAKEVRKENREITPRKILHTSLAVISTVCFVIGVVRLGPISKRALKSNECIKTMSSKEEYQKLDTIEKFMKCNGFIN